MCSGSNFCILYLKLSRTVREYTVDADFDLGSAFNVNHKVSDQLQLNSEGKSFNYTYSYFVHCDSVVNLR